MRIFQTKSLLFGSGLQGRGLGSHTAGSKSPPASRRTVRMTDGKPRATAGSPDPGGFHLLPQPALPVSWSSGPRRPCQGSAHQATPLPSSSTSGSGPPARETHRHASSLTATPQPQGPENTLLPRAARSTLRRPTGGGQQNLSRRHRS